MDNLYIYIGSLIYAYLYQQQMLEADDRTMRRQAETDRLSSRA
jgi:hypothetical protein